MMMMMDLKLDRSLVNLIFLSFSFMLLYAPYLASSSIIKYSLEFYNMSDVSFVAISILYASFGAGNLIAPFVLEHFAVRKLLFFFSFAFSFYLSSYIHPIKELIYTSASVLGISNAVLWASQSTYLTRNCMKNNLSRDNSIFRGIFQLSSLLGGFFLLFAMRTSSEKKDLFFYIFLSFVLIALLAAISMLMIWYRSREDSNQLEFEKGSNNQANRKTFKFGDVFRLFRDIRFVMMIPLILQSGMNASFLIMIYPSFLTSVYKSDTSDERLLDPEIVAEYNIALSLAISISNAILVLLGARVTKNVNVFAMMFAMGISIIGFLMLAHMFHQFSNGSYAFFPCSPLSSHRAIAITVSVLTGISEGISSTRIVTLLGSRYTDSLPAVFSMYKLFQTLTTSISFALGLKLKFITRMYFMSVLNIIGTSFYIYTLIKHEGDHKVIVSGENSTEVLEIEPESQNTV